MNDGEGVGDRSAGRVYNCRVLAEVAQLVERNLAKVEVAGSSPVFRSRFRQPMFQGAGVGQELWLRAGDVAEWLGAGLQNPSLRFNSGRRLQRRMTPGNCQRIE
jgi:hypothetical protein